MTSHALRSIPRLALFATLAAVVSARAGEEPGVRLQQVMLACANGDSMVQLLELTAVSPLQTLDPALTLTITNRVGAVVRSDSMLFDPIPAGTPWPVGTHWWIGTPACAVAAGATPDRVEAPLLDPYGGTVTLSLHGVTLDSLAYGAQGVAAPWPGRSLVRTAGSAWTESRTPSATGFGGQSALAFACDCLIQNIRLCGDEEALTDARANRDMICSTYPNASGSGAYDLAAGTFSAQVGADCEGGADAGVTARDVFWVVGPPAGAPLTIGARLAVHLCVGSSNCPSYQGSGEAHATIDAVGRGVGESVTRFAIAGHGECVDTTLAADLAVQAQEPFTLEVTLDLAGAGGTALTYATLTFSGAPSGAAVVSCRGYASDPAVPVLASLIEASAAPDRVRLTWFAVAGPAEPVVERSRDGATWAALGRALPAGPDRWSYDDDAVTPGERLAYRLRIDRPGSSDVTAPAWVLVPEAMGLALGAPRPQPARQAFEIPVTAPAGARATLEMVDVSGRRVLVRTLAPIVGGTANVRLDPPPLPPGIYLLRLRSGAETATARIAIVR